MSYFRQQGTTNNNIYNFFALKLIGILRLFLKNKKKAYMVFREVGKEDSIGKLPGATSKFLGKSGRTQGTSNQTNSISLQQGNFTDESDGITVGKEN